MSDNNKTARTLEGRVISNKMHKTVTVLIERQAQHPLIGNIMGFLRRSGLLQTSCVAHALSAYLPAAGGQS